MFAPNYIYRSFVTLDHSQHLYKYNIDPKLKINTIYQIHRHSLNGSCWPDKPHDLTLLKRERIYIIFNIMRLKNKFRHRSLELDNLIYQIVRVYDNIESSVNFDK